uniref:Putative group ii salivary lipocalin n=1 Tax=Rhipicephalus pulchellus TaxID=72859 RepID=L7LQ88_RHIPC
MSSFTLVLCILFAARSTLAEEEIKKDPNACAENSKNFSIQDISYMTNVNKTLYVKKRDYNTTTEFECLSAIKLFQYENGSYEYTLTARTNGSFQSHNVTMTPMRTGNHQVDNSAHYQELPGEEATHHRLMATDKESCFLFATTLKNGKYGCLLVATENAIEHISEKCLSVYDAQCEEGVDLYKSDCKNSESEGQVAAALENNYQI